MHPKMLHSCSMINHVLYVLILQYLWPITMHCVIALFMLLLVCVQGIIPASPGLAVAKSVWAVWTKDWGSPQSSSQSSLWDRRQPRGCQSRVWGTPYCQGESPQQDFYWWCHFPWLFPGWIHLFVDYHQWLNLVLDFHTKPCSLDFFFKKLITLATKVGTAWFHPFPHRKQNLRSETTQKVSAMWPSNLITGHKIHFTG